MNNVNQGGRIFSNIETDTSLRLEKKGIKAYQGVLGTIEYFFASIFGKTASIQVGGQDVSYNINSARLFLERNFDTRASSFNDNDVKDIINSALKKSNAKVDAADPKVIDTIQTKVSEKISEKKLGAELMIMTEDAFTKFIKTGLQDCGIQLESVVPFEKTGKKYVSIEKDKIIKLCKESPHNLNKMKEGLKDETILSSVKGIVWEVYRELESNNIKQDKYKYKVDYFKNVAQTTTKDPNLLKKLSFDELIKICDVLLNEKELDDVAQNVLHALVYHKDLDFKDEAIIEKVTPLLEKNQLFKAYFDFQKIFDKREDSELNEEDITQFFDLMKTHYANIQSEQNSLIYKDIADGLAIFLDHIFGSDLLKLCQKFWSEEQSQATSIDQNENPVQKLFEEKLQKHDEFSVLADTIRKEKYANEVTLARLGIKNDNEPYCKKLFENIFSKEDLKETDLEDLYSLLERNYENIIKNITPEISVIDYKPLRNEINNFLKSLDINSLRSLYEKSLNSSVLDEEDNLTKSLAIRLSIHKDFGELAKDIQEGIVNTHTNSQK